ncbi:MAG: DAK2 domain-containing protein [Clostridia bacterium]|nr:DAK2 domain-containing protein [Clostridia bacterium]
MNRTMQLDGKTLRRMLIGAAETIRANSDKINDLNVFPVPDGDTGINMTKTIEGGIAEISSLDEASVSDVTHKFAHGALLGARGNSGVILSQIFAGIEEVLGSCTVATVRDFVAAFRSGVKKAYDSVMNPTEGTILTVFREATEYAASMVNDESSIEEFLYHHIEEGKRSLMRTKDILPVLKEADVVDSGAAGYLSIAVGMYAALSGEKSFDAYEFSGDTQAQAVSIEAFTRDSVLEFGYCTEFLLRLQTAKTNPDTFDITVIKDFLDSIGGDSVVAYKTDDVVKVHVHTEKPGTVLNEMRKYGEFLTVKIENMSLQHNESEIKKSRSPMAVLAVATGEGICELFRSIGADGIISGGQTSNPSAEEIIDALREANADKIILLPNNKNIFLAANQAASLFADSEVYIVPTESIVQGYAALSVITHDVHNIESVIKSAISAAKNVVSAEITYAVRDAVVNGKGVKKGDYMALSDHDIKATAETAADALIGFLEGVEDMDMYEIITLFVGKDVTDDERADLTERIEELYPDCEVIVYKGGQDVYSYLVAIE